MKISQLEEGHCYLVSCSGKDITTVYYNKEEDGREVFCGGCKKYDITGNIIGQCLTPQQCTLWSVDEIIGKLSVRETILFKLKHNL